MFAREDVPLPTQPPYTAFIGNLAFDLAEADIAGHFSEFKVLQPYQMVQTWF